MDKHFPEVAAAVVAAQVPLANPSSNNCHIQSSLQSSTASPAITGGGLKTEPLFESDVLGKDALKEGKEGMLERKLNLESVLRSL